MTAQGVEGAPTKRGYDSPMRREQAARTRERIIAAAADLGRELSSWDWRGITIAAVAARAGVHERTVFRHLGSEASLRTEVAERLEREAGSAMGGLRLDTVPALVRSLYAFLVDVPGVVAPNRVDPALAAVDARRRDSLRAALDHEGLSGEQQTQIAAVLDVLATPASFRRLALAWELDGRQAAEAAAWVAELVVDAVQQGRRPGGAT